MSVGMPSISADLGVTPSDKSSFLLFSFLLEDQRNLSINFPFYIQYPIWLTECFFFISPLASSICPSPFRFDQCSVFHH
jgi:hypothetical protein